MTPPATIRPRDLAMLLLSSGDLLPRQRARDQQPDLLGMELKRRVLERLRDIDPEPEACDAALFRIVDEFGAPTGPTRAIAIGIREEWQAACIAPEMVGHLLSQAVQQATEEKRRGG